MNPRITELRSILNQANTDYYVLSSPKITDGEYDRLFKELKELETSNPDMADPNSPTSRVGGRPIEAFVKVKHRYPMLSLDNTFSAGDVAKFWRQSQPLVVEAKIDGLSLSLLYQSGQLVRATTRGDGTIGNDVTANARTISTIPLVVPNLWSGEVRGEVYMSNAQFNKLNSVGDEEFANPRNAASGSMNRLDSSEVAKRGLSFVAYASPTICDYELEQGSGIPRTQAALLEFLQHLGFVTTLDLDFFWYVDSNDEAAIESILKEASDRRSGLDFGIDGLVFKVDSLDDQESMGIGTRSPKWATSYKFPPEQVRTRLNAITVQVGRLGTLTPVAELEPVLLAGSTIRRATLHNAQQVERLGLNVGDILILQKAADVIPAVCRYPEGRVFTCPTCGFKGTLDQQEKHHAVSQSSSS